jgi:hypothetical protein
MAEDFYKISISLRKASGPVVTFATRTAAGDILRGGRVLVDRTELPEAVESYQAGVASYDRAAHEAAHRLAVKAAQAQRDEERHNGEAK